jgi:drug/metabolite transporter (DMT)-like permease
MTFVMAVIFRMEKIDLKKVRCQAKMAGTVVTVAGAMLMTLYKGPLVELVWSKHIHSGKSYEATSSASTTYDKDFFKGTMFLIIATLSWAGLFVLQTHALKTYRNHQLSLTSLVCFVGTLQAIAVTFVMEHKPSAWQIGFDMRLLAAAYAGIVTSSISYYVQGLVIKKKGPVFATAFSPLMMIIVAIMGSFILAEKIFLGGVVGSVLIVFGLYVVLWGKHKETIEIKEEEIPEAIKGAQVNGNAISGNIEDIEANNGNIQMGKAEGGDHQNKAAAALSCCH